MKTTLYYNERQVTVAYILHQELLSGPFFTIYDKANKIAEAFLVRYPPSKNKWDGDKQWDEAVETFTLVYLKKESI